MGGLSEFALCQQGAGRFLDSATGGGRSFSPPLQFTCHENYTSLGPCGFPLPGRPQASLSPELTTEPTAGRTPKGVTSVCEETKPSAKMTKRALLAGNNYPGSQAALNGCINDCLRMHEMLTSSFGFEGSNITMLLDTDPSTEQPTGGNIKKRLTEMVAASEAGDVLVFHFSGHGTQIPSKTGNESDGKDEAICPTDMNLIVDDDLRRILMNLKSGVAFTMIADCCHSGTMLDHAAVHIEGNKDPNAPEIPDLGSLGALFGLKEVETGGDRGLEINNRSLPIETVFSMLENATGGKVNASNIHQTISGMFGADASPMISSIASMALPMLMSQLSGAGQGGSSAGGASGGASAATAAASGCMPMIMGMLCGGSKPQADAAPAPAASNYQAPQGHLPGQKPPAGEQLPDDKGILVTGCQAFETSADACPGGDKTKAYGALSNAIQTVVKQHMSISPDAPLTNLELVTRVRAVLLKTGFKQNPCLEGSMPHAQEPFICAP